jgi:beta-lactam-binding protein with PASTA domain
VAVGTEVTVKVGVILQVPVPDFSGMTIEQAQVAASNVGLSVIAAGTTDTDIEALAGTVATQNPAPGTPVDEGSTVQVTLYVFVPPPTTIPPEPPTTTTIAEET